MLGLNYTILLSQSFHSHSGWNVRCDCRTNLAQSVESNDAYCSSTQELHMSCTVLTAVAAWKSESPLPPFPMVTTDNTPRADVLLGSFVSETKATRLFASHVSLLVPFCTSIDCNLEASYRTWSWYRLSDNQIQLVPTVWNNSCNMTQRNWQNKHFGMQWTNIRTHLCGTNTNENKTRSQTWRRQFGTNKLPFGWRMHLHWHRFLAKL